MMPQGGTQTQFIYLFLPFVVYMFLRGGSRVYTLANFYLLTLERDVSCNFSRILNGWHRVYCNATMLSRARAIHQETEACCPSVQTVTRHGFLTF